MNICVFGASIAWGEYDCEKGGWVDRLKVYLNERYDDALVYNLGVSGDSTDDLLARIRCECEAREPDIIVFEIGINDSQYLRSKNGRRIPLDRFKKNLAKLCKIAREFTEKVIFLGFSEADESKTNPVPWDTDASYDNDAIKSYGAAIKEFCLKKGLSFVEIAGLLSLSDLADGLHPNPQGHEKIFSKMKSVLESGELGIKKGQTAGNCRI